MLWNCSLIRTWACLACTRHIVPFVLPFFVFVFVFGAQRSDVVCSCCSCVICDFCTCSSRAVEVNLPLCHVYKASLEVLTIPSSAWGQCGGVGWSGATTCVSGYAYETAIFSSSDKQTLTIMIKIVIRAPTQMIVCTVP